MATMPGSADTLADGEGRDVGAKGDNVTDNFVAGCAGEDRAEVALLDGYVREADAAGEDFHKDLVCGWGFKGDRLDGEGGIFVG